MTTDRAARQEIDADTQYPPGTALASEYPHLLGAHQRHGAQWGRTRETPGGHDDHLTSSVTMLEMMAPNKKGPT